MHNASGMRLDTYTLNLCFYSFTKLTVEPSPFCVCMTGVMERCDHTHRGGLRGIVQQPCQYKCR